MPRCPACGLESQVGARFCSACGAAFGLSTTAAAEERKVVTVLFADLVGFTSRSEQLDPEDVRAFLSPYYARLRRELEHFGGTVEKFIGDAVMALFGAPFAHEDDPERAVRAALAIRDWVTDQGEGLQLRIAVNTGEVLVVLGAQLSQGEGMASGDVVNTTARLQTAAPVNGILVGETTYRATSHVITYRDADPVAAKGKSEPVRAWLALEARSRFGVDVGSAGRTPMVGRDHEIGVLTEALAWVRQERATQLVTIVGVPGIGKSRLVAELFAAVDADPNEVTLWRQGRSLPYGDGITFWALAEMVKAQAGILETDSSEQADDKLRRCVGELLPDSPDAAWIEGHLRPLAGLSSETESAGDRRDEAFMAWRRFFESLADVHPLALVFEDMHWADDNVLDFVNYLVDWASGVPMLVVCSARPELYERRAGWGGGARNATTLSLSSLSDEATAQLICSLSERPVMAAETQQVLLTRAGGNPLYAEQYVRMLGERSDAEVLPLPETVQGIIAARLDALPADQKRLLRAAAVMGKVFWLGALLQPGGPDRRTAEAHLHALERKDFVRRARCSLVADEAEYSFLHVLVRDVAYGQIPRGERAEQHRRAAEWIASLGRTEDHAEMMAHHYMSAVELRRAAGLPLDLTLAEQAFGSLRAAGDRAVSLNAYTSAAAYYQSALELAPAASEERSQLLFQLGRARYVAGDTDPTLLAAACDGLLDCGDLDTAAEAEAVLAQLHWYRGETSDCAEHLDRARALIEAREPSRAKAGVIIGIAAYLWLSGELAEAIRLGREALSMTEDLGLVELRAHALVIIGGARWFTGDAAGVDDLEQGLATALEANAPPAICRAQINISATLYDRGQLTRSLAVLEEAAATASRFGLAGNSRWIRVERAGTHYDLGQWDEAVTGASEFIAEVEAGSPHYRAAYAYGTRAQVRLGRGDGAGALTDAQRALKLARATKDPHNVLPVLADCADILYEGGKTNRASTVADECLVHFRAERGIALTDSVLFTVLARTLSALGRGHELSEVLPRSDNPWVRAAAAFASGKLEAAADICDGMGAATEAARIRLWLADSLVGQDRRAEADIHLQRALAFYRSVAASHYLSACETLLAASA